MTRRLMLILLAAVLANLLLFWHSQTKPTQRFYDPAAYLAAQQDLLKIAPHQRLAYAQERYQMLEVCLRWERYDTLVQGGTANPADIDEEMLSYQQMYESGAYLQYTDNLYFESQIFRELVMELQDVDNHRAKLEAAIQDAKLKTSVSIFAKPGTFPYRNQLAIIEQLEKLTYIVPVYDVSSGVLQAQGSAATDLIALMLVLIVCTELVITEHKNGMMPILRATRKGRLPLILSKVGATFVVVCLITLALWGSNLVYCAATVGLGDLSRPVQSLTGYTVCALEMSVDAYLLLFLLFKWLLYVAVGLLCLIVGLVLQNTMATWLTLGGFLSIEYILCQTIHSVSAWNILKYVNISNMIFSTDWLEEYRNLNFFGYPADVFTVACVLVVALLALGVLLLCILFCRRNIRVLPKLPNLLQWPLWLPRLGKRTSLFGHEGWKLLVECGTFFVLALFVFLNLQEPRTVAYSTDELYYKYYMEALEGPLTLEQELFLEEEADRFDELRKELRQLSKDYAAGHITEAERNYLQAALESALKPEQVLINQVQPQIDRLRVMQAQGKDPWVVYEPGYMYLFGIADYNDKTDVAAMLVAAILLCFSNYYPMESASGMLPLLNTYPRGRMSTAGRKITIGVMITVVLFFIGQIPDYWYVVKNYGFPALRAPLCSLEPFSGWNTSVSILDGIVIFEGLRLLSAISAMSIVLLLSAWTGNQVATLSLSAGVLLLPILLHLLGVTFLDPISFYYPLTATELVSASDPLVSSLLYFGAIYLLGVLSLVLLLGYSHNGYHHKPLWQMMKQTDHL